MSGTATFVKQTDSRPEEHVAAVYAIEPPHHGFDHVWVSTIWPNERTSQHLVKHPETAVFPLNGTSHHSARGSAGEFAMGGIYAGVTSHAEALALAGYPLVPEQGLDEEQHVDYPHEPGRLYDCPACEAKCHCKSGETECVFEGEHNGLAE